MPLYEYRCRDCGEVVEFRSSMDRKQEMAAALRCESCGSDQLTQVFGGIALTGESKSGGSNPPPPSGGGCPGGMCNLQ
ncbi:MAG: zinc ribbon domain-containing protein [Cyclonatronaceae bacterium]